MLFESLGSSCRSKEFANYNLHIKGGLYKDLNNGTRYKILFHKKDVSVSKHDKKLNWIKILDLSGDVDEFDEEQHVENKDQLLDAQNSNQNQLNHGKMENELVSHESNPIQNIFKRKDDEVIDHTMAETDRDGIKIWGKIVGNISGFLSNDNTSVSESKGSVYLTVGPYFLRGNKVDIKGGENLVILRKVPDHCSCVCSESISDDSSHVSHLAYYEICGVVNKKIEFKERPIFYQTEIETQSDEYYLYLSNCINNNWFIIRVNDEILNNMLEEHAYFKLVNLSESEKKAVLCILNNTYHIERVELAGTLLFLFSMSDIVDGSSDLLVIVGSSKYAYNLIKSNPIFDLLPKLSNIDFSSLIDQTPISDLEISDFIMGKYEYYPTYYLYQSDNTLKYMGQYFFGEFTVRILQSIPIYFSNHPDKKKRILELTVGDMWTIVKTYKDIFEFVPENLLTVSTLFQVLLKVSDIDETFSNTDEYLTLIKSDLITDLNFKLNLFKIQKLVSWCVVSANSHREITYFQYVYCMDDVLFNRAVPSYVFDELIEYMLKIDTDNIQVSDYLKCVKFYYNNVSFTEVSNLLENKNMSHFEIKNMTIFDRTGVNLFMIGEMEFKSPETHKLPCLNYELFKINTKGLTHLRFSNSMNSLISMCRCPMSLHLSYLCEKIVAILESNTCLIKVYPMVNHENLRDTLSELFKLKNTWHLEVLENKLKSFFKEKPAIDTLTGGPDYHGRLWITKEINNQNYENKNKLNEFKYEEVEKWKSNKEELRHIKEESYIIINWNVPV